MLWVIWQCGVWNGLIVLGLELGDVGLHGKHGLLHVGHKLGELINTFLGSNG